MNRRKGVFDFSHVTRVLDAMEEAGISCDHWNTDVCDPDLDGKIPSGCTGNHKEGPGIYGARQIMDITHPVYRYLCGTCDPKTDGSVLHTENVLLASSWIMRQNIMIQQEKMCRSSL